MHIRFIVVGKCAKGPIAELVREYLKRFTWQVSVQEIIPKKMSNSVSQKEHEAELILNACPKGGKLVILDERGENPNTIEISDRISSWQGQGFSSFCFVIGGADGLATTVRQKADWVLSFGQMTWPHMLMRVLLLEQLYRVQQVIANHPYHRI